MGQVLSEMYGEFTVKSTEFTVKGIPYSKIFC